MIGLYIEPSQVLVTRHLKIGQINHLDQISGLKIRDMVQKSDLKN
jgi:hypothetical protein